MRRPRLGPWWGPLVMGSVSVLVGCDDGVEADGRATGASVDMPQLDVRTAPLPLANCSYDATTRRLAWQVPPGATAVVSQSPATRAIVVNGVTCATGAVGSLRLTLGDEADLTLDHGAAGLVLLPGKAGPGITLEAAGRYALAVRMTARADIVTAGTLGLSFNADDVLDLGWSAAPTTLRVATDAGHDSISGLGGRGTGPAISVPLRIFGGDGNDVLAGGLLADHLEGGAGNDTFNTAPSADGADVYLGGDGLDVMSYAATAVSAMRVHDGRWSEGLGEDLSACLGRTPVAPGPDGLPCDPARLDAAGHFGVLVVTGAYLDGERWRPVTWPWAAPAEEVSRCAVTTIMSFNARLRREVATRTWERAPLATDGARVLAKGSGRILDITDPGCAARFARAGAATGESADPSDPMSLWCLASVVTEGDLFEGVETVQGTGGQDVMAGGGCQAVSLQGLGGDDVLYPGLGNEGGRVDGGNGDDLLLLGLGVGLEADSNGATTYAGGRGIDMIACPGCETGVYVSLDGKPNDGFRATTWYPEGYRPRAPCRTPRKEKGQDGDNVLGDIEVIEGGLGDDVLLGLRGVRMLSGGAAGHDLVLGGRSRDFLHAGTLAPGGGLPLASMARPSARVARSWPILLGDFLSVTPLTALDADSLLPDRARAPGSVGFPILCGSLGSDLMVGSAGRDYMYGGPGEDIMLGHEGDDVLAGASNSDYLDGGEGADVLRAGQAMDLSFCGGDDGDAAVIDRQDAVCVPADDPAAPFVGAGWARFPALPKLCRLAPAGTPVTDKLQRLSRFPAFHGCSGPAPGGERFWGPALPGELEEPACEPACENGAECTLAGTCACEPGWSGPTCGVPRCSSPCGPNQVCDEPDLCSCADGWQGEHCDDPVCLPSCENGGVCTGPNTCTCPEGWEGEACAQAVCTTPCQNGGICAAPDTCECVEGFSGALCETAPPGGGTLGGGTNSGGTLGGGAGGPTDTCAVPGAATFVGVDGPQETVGSFACDLDRDGLDDAIFVNQLAGNISIYWGTTAGVLDAPTTVPTGRVSGSGACGDLNRDGRIDLVLSRQDSNSVLVLLANGRRTFGGGAAIGGLSFPSRVALADVNQDGHLDLLAAVGGTPWCCESATKEWRLLLGSGTGAFAAPTRAFSTTEGRHDLAFGDLDGDGGVEAVTARDGAALIMKLDAAGQVTSETRHAPTDCDVTAVLVTRPRAGLFLGCGAAGWRSYAVVDGAVSATGCPLPSMPSTCGAQGTSPCSPKAILDFNGDGLRDFLDRHTCSFCTSRHYLALGTRPQVPAGYVRVEPASFPMGSPATELGRFSNETQHPVTLTWPFFLAVTEVTQGQWKALSGGRNPSAFPDCGDACPVEQVTWWSALGFLNALSLAEGLSPCYALPASRPDGMPCAGTWQDGTLDCGVASPGLEADALHLCSGYRLPTEAEWEHAARAGTTTATWLGDLAGTVSDCITPQGSLDAAAWWCRTAGGAAGGRTQPVGSKRANPWGLHDMLGNVFEWTHDWFATYSGAAVDPVGPLAGNNRVSRGGAWNLPARNQRAATRNNNPPGHRVNTLGFRVARTAEVCSPACENGGTCMGPNRCACPEGWQGAGCDVPVCEVTCWNGAGCSGPDTCACLPGWEGAACDTPTCAAACENGGTCAAPDTCACAAGWAGPTCDAPVCTLGCGNGGTCIGPDTCTCPEGWQGATCTTPVCSPACQNGGTCTSPNACTCPTGFSGALCEVAPDGGSGGSTGGGGEEPAPPACYAPGAVSFNSVRGPRETVGSFACDLDLDGRDDAIFVNQLAGNVSVYWGSAAGVLGAPTVVPTGRVGGAGGCGDFNEDGRVDLVLTRQDSSSVLIVPASGQRTFGAGTAIGGLTFASRLAVADVDRDGHLDLLVAVGGTPWCCESATKDWKLLRGTGTGAFLAPTQAFATVLGRHNLQFGDLDGDGDLEAASLLGDQIFVRHLGANGRITAEEALLPANCRPRGLLVVDAQGSADATRAADELAVGCEGGVWRVYAYGAEGLSTSGCAIPAMPAQCGAAGGSACVPQTLLDFNGDGLLDFLDRDTCSYCDSQHYLGVGTTEAPPEGFVRIGRGGFIMGSPSQEAGRRADEGLHAVTLTRDFFLGATEVTQGQWRALSGGVVPPSFAACGDTCPVVNVSWWSAVGFLNALSEAHGFQPCYRLASGPSARVRCTGSWQAGTLDCGVAAPTVQGANVQACSGYRLPTEAEWEYAARAGTTTATWLGDLSGNLNSCGALQPNLDPLAWWCGNAASRVREVGVLRANPWGLHDILGNVWEWTHDRYDLNLGPATDPSGPAAGLTRVIRGGGWSSEARLVRSATRSANVPGYRGLELGFRAARSVPMSSGQSSGSAPGSSGQSSGSAPGSSGHSSGSAPGSSGQAH
jgi:formylglycine-generating enzyme required for sulfatase activity/Ca2+-binding RTX toxin-like protein